MRLSRWLQLASLPAFALSPALATVDGWRDIRTIPGFRGWRTQLQRTADEDSHARLNHFCVVVRLMRGKDGPDNKAFVYWREGQSIQAYGQTSYEVSPATESGGDYVDLRHDVVASEREINGSIARVTRAYVNEIMRECHRVGTSVTVLKRPGKGQR